MKRLVLCFVLSPFLCVPLIRAQTVKVNWQSSAPFATYKTFAWQEPKNPGLPFYAQWIKPDVTAELSQRGLQQVGSGQTPDLVATFHVSGQEMIDAQTTSDGFDYGPGPWGAGWESFGGWGGWGDWPIDQTSFTTEHPRQIVILTVDLLDARHKKLVWRGQATVEDASNSENGDRKQTEKCIQKMFKGYPPKTSK